MKNTFFDSIAKEYDYWKNRNKRYYNKLKVILRNKIPSDSSILDFGCGTGDLLAYLNPVDGIGYDPSPKMIKISQYKYPSLNWSNCIPTRQFDIVYSVDVIEHVNDLSTYLLEMKGCLKTSGKLILIFANPYWEPILLLLEKLRLKMSEGSHHRFSNRTVKQHLTQNGLQISQLEYFMPQLKKIGLIEVWTIFIS